MAIWGHSGFDFLGLFPDTQRFAGPCCTQLSPFRISVQLTALITVRELQGYAEKPSSTAAGPKSPNLPSLSPLPRSHSSICRGLEPPSFPASIYSCPVVLAPFVLVPTLSSSPASSSPFLVLPLDVLIAGQQLFVPHTRRAPRGGISLFRPGDEERKGGQLSPG